jgi:hypothetical protein
LTYTGPSQTIMHSFIGCFLSRQTPHRCPPFAERLLPNASTALASFCRPRARAGSE